MYQRPLQMVLFAFAVPASPKIKGSVKNSGDAVECVVDLEETIEINDPDYKFTVFSEREILQ